MMKKLSMLATVGLIAAFGLVYSAAGSAEQTSLGQVQQARPTPLPRPEPQPRPTPQPKPPAPGPTNTGDPPPAPAPPNGG